MSEVIAGRFAIGQSEPRRGGFAVVRKAWDLRDECQVAVKSIFAPRAELIPLVFERERQALQTLSHRNIVRYIDGGLDETETPYIVLEWIERSLADVLASHGPYTWDELVPKIAAPLTQALAAAHMKGIEHRDIKPQNVLIRDNDEPALADFGISKLRESLDTPELTVAVFRSAAYAPPETDAPMRYVRDVYSLGVLFIQAMVPEKITQFHEIAPALSGLRVPPGIRAVLERCIDTDPSARPQNGSVLRDELQRHQSDYLRLRAQPGRVAWLRLTNKARAQIFEFVIGESDDSTEETALARDLTGDVYAEFRYDVEADRLDPETIFIIGDSLRLTVRPDASSGCLNVVTVKAPEFEELERIRRRSHLVRRTLAWSCHEPRDKSAARAGFDFLSHCLEDFHESRDVAKEEQQLAVSSESLFDKWDSILKARADVARGALKAMRYREHSARNRDATFTLVDPVDVDLQGVELEVLVDETKRRLGRGEVVLQDGDTITIRSRTPWKTLPARATLAPSLGPTQVSIDRQVDAVTAVKSGNAARSSLRELILDPRTNAAPVPVTITEWHQDLDSGKRDAVESAVGATDVLLVQGPPGTGKTSFITEAVAQYLQRNPEARVLLVSQTHVAVDNALERLAKIGVGQMVRLAAYDDSRVDPAVRPLLLDRQMAVWASNVRKTAETYLEEAAAAEGASARHLHAALAIQEYISYVRQLERVETHLAEAVATPDSDLATALESGANDAVVLQERMDRLAEQCRESLDAAEKLLEGDLTVRHGMSVEEADHAIGALLGRSESATRLLGLVRLQAEWLQRVASDENLAPAYLMTTQVVAGTCLGFLRNPAVRSLHFDLCVLDEASKATTTEALVPLVRASRWILVGDTNQLAPMDEDLLRDRSVMEEYDLQPTEVTETLFQRFADTLPEHSQKRLREQYRMIRPIGDLISTCFYKGDLVSPRTVGLAGYEHLGQPVLWIDTSRLGPQRREETLEGQSKSYVNRAESRLVVDRLKAIDGAIEKGLISLPASADTLDVLVIAPYRRQVEELKRATSRVTLRHLRITHQSVDAVQGKEADIAIFSVTRSNPRGGLGFIGADYWKRINVALSRARFGLTIVGDMDFCESTPGALRTVAQYIRATDNCEIRAADK